jgi:hypothetical protein
VVNSSAAIGTSTATLQPFGVELAHVALREQQYTVGNLRCEHGTVRHEQRGEGRREIPDRRADPGGQPQDELLRDTSYSTRLNRLSDHCLVRKGAPTRYAQ